MSLTAHALPNCHRGLAEWLSTNNRRLVVIIVGQLRTASDNIESLRANLLNRCQHLVLVQCPNVEVAAAVELFKDAIVDGWDPDVLPFALRYSWPIWGSSGYAARSTKSSFYYQLARQRRAVEVFSSLIEGDRDIVLKWRPDLKLLEPIYIDPVEIERSLLIPSYDNHDGLNDQCAIGPWSVMCRYFNRIESLRSYFLRGGVVHPESYLLWSMRAVPVAQSRIVYVINRTDGTACIKMSGRRGDVHDLGVIASLRSHGVTVVDDSAEIERDASVSRIKNIGGRIWQMAIALFFWPVFSSEKTTFGFVCRD